MSKDFKFLVPTALNTKGLNEFYSISESKELRVLEKFLLLLRCRRYPFFSYKKKQEDMRKALFLTTRALEKQSILNKVIVQEIIAIRLNKERVE